VEVRRRAHQIYLERGCQPGHEVDDWLQAEYELMQLPVRKLAQIDPPKMRRRNPSEKTLISVVHAALLFGAGSLHRFQ
jgi:hypothetical protein